MLDIYYYHRLHCLLTYSVSTFLCKNTHTRSLLSFQQFSLANELTKSTSSSSRNSCIDRLQKDRMQRERDIAAAGNKNLRMKNSNGFLKRLNQPNEVNKTKSTVIIILVYTFFFFFFLPASFFMSFFLEVFLCKKEESYLPKYLE